MLKLRLLLFQWMVSLLLKYRIIALRIPVHTLSHCHSYIFRFKYCFDAHKAYVGTYLKSNNLL